MLVLFYGKGLNEVILMKKDIITIINIWLSNSYLSLYMYFYIFFFVKNIDSKGEESSLKISYKYVHYPIVQLNIVHPPTKPSLSTSS